MEKLVEIQGYLLLERYRASLYIIICRLDTMVMDIVTIDCFGITLLVDNWCIIYPIECFMQVVAPFVVGKIEARISRGRNRESRTSGGGLEREEMVYHWHIPCISSASGIGVVTGNTRELLTTMGVNENVN